MSVTFEQIEILRERASVTYAEAKKVLEETNGDVLEALIKLEGQSKVRSPKKHLSDYEAWKTSKGIMGALKKLVKKGNKTKFLIRKGEVTVIDMPVTLLVIITAIMPPLTIAGLLVAMFTGHKISMVKADGSGLKINHTFDKVSTCVSSVGNQVKDAIKEEK